MVIFSKIESLFFIEDAFAKSRQNLSKITNACHPSIAPRCQCTESYIYLLTTMSTIPIIFGRVSENPLQ